MCDFHEFYGFELDDRAARASRSFAWFMTRLNGIFSRDSRVSRHFAPDPEE